MEKDAECTKKDADAEYALNKCLGTHRDEYGMLVPVHPHRDGTWFFFDETWADEHGPYQTQEEAGAACKRYAKEVLGSREK